MGVRRALWLLILAAAVSAEARGQSSNAADLVKPIDWSAFTPVGALKARDPDLAQSAELLLHSLRYNVRWIPSAIDKIKSRPNMAGREAHDVIRPACNVLYAIALVIRTGLFDPSVLGFTEAHALDAARRLMDEVVAAHERRRHWDYPWMSSLWAGHLGDAGWMLWSDLDGPLRRRLVAVIEAEADRFVNYTVPYWTGRPTDGDTKAEENSWNAMALRVAVAMMPAHPHATLWKEKCSELMVSAYALKTDLENPRVLDGKPVRTWLKGYNVREDGAVINHGAGFVHPDYMTAITAQLRAYLSQSLAGQPVPETTDFNADFIYRTFVVRRWESPPYKKPGGTIYVPGEAIPYYPSGTDWSVLSLVEFYMMDAFAHTFGWDKDLPHPATDWMRLRARKLRELQVRHPDGRIWADGEYETWVGREQTAARIIGDVYHLRWLAAQDKLMKKGSWLR